ncbi:6891_t:CDS:2 [Ambispora gerdemannii]|uniref:6891_t:CDS:1 n=1 Tax=Ambispora gerdemannii TaxID=144530 RepID=A0A9N8V6V9_9GLOM|nr:6891_t:CDS:2 [Ambispora gerdemannii]
MNAHHNHQDQPFEPHESSFDVIIIGGGIAGSSFAITISQLLSSSGSTTTFRKILIIEEKPKNLGTFKVGESLPGEAKPVLRSLGVLKTVDNDTIQEKHLFCYGNKSVWGSTNINGTDSIFNPYGNGFHLDRLLFEETLLKTTELQYGQIVKVIRGFGVTGLCFDFKDDCAENTKCWKITISKCSSLNDDSAREMPKKIYGKILVDASGRRCCIRKCMPSLKRHSFDKLLAFACLFESAYHNGLKDNDHHTLVESCCYGWFQTSRLPNNQRVIIFFTDDDLVKRLPRRIRAVDEFLDFLRENTLNIDKILKEFDYMPVGNRIMCTAANSEVLSEFASIENHWIAVGDSAISFDPLSSQGILTTLYNSKLGAEAIFFQFLYNRSPKESSNNNENTNGNIQPFDIYKHQLTQVLTKYQKEKNYFYVKEQRWVKEVFWKRRHSE